MLKGATTGWTACAKWMHWGTVLAIIVVAPAGYIMSRTYGAIEPGPAALQFLTSRIHHTIGLSLIVAVIFRALWRVKHAVPDLPKMTKPLTKAMAQGSHLLLYLLLLFVPLSGWAAISSLANDPSQPVNHLWFFTHDGFGPDGLLPHIVPAVPWNAPVWFKYSFFAGTHRMLLILGAATISLHFLAALFHHFRLRDDVLLDMLPVRKHPTCPPKPICAVNDAQIHKG